MTVMKCCPTCKESKESYSRPSGLLTCSSCLSDFTDAQAKETFLNLKKDSLIIPHPDDCPIGVKGLTDAELDQMYAELEAPQTLKTRGLKYDDAKPRMDLLDTQFIEEVAGVMTFGAKKYAAHNWRKGLEVSRCLAAAVRHTFALIRGEDLDKESGLSHAAHATCCLMFAWRMLKSRPDLDDRYKDQG